MTRVSGYVCGSLQTFIAAVRMSVRAVAVEAAAVATVVSVVASATPEAAIRMLDIFSASAAAA